MASDIKAGRAFVELLLRDRGFAKGLNAASAKLRSFGRSTMVWGSTITAAGSAIVGPLVAITKAFSDAGSNLYDMSQRTNESVKTLQELGYAADQTGISIEHVEKAIHAARKEGKSLDEMAAQVAAITDPAKQSQKAIELFGKKLGPSLVPMLRDLPELQKRFRELGLGMSEREAAAADELGDAFADLRMVVLSARNAVGAALGPVVLQATKTITNIAIAVRNWVKENGDLFAALMKIGVVIMGVGAVLTSLGGAMAVTGMAISAFVAVMGVASTVVGAIVSPIGLAVAGLIGLATWFATCTEWGRQFVQTLSEYFGALLDTARETFGGISDAIASGDLALAAKVAWAGIQVAWLEGTQWIRQKWAEFKDFYLRTTTELVFNALRIWTNFKSSVVGLWTVLENTSKSIGESIGHWLTRSSDPALAAEQDAAHEVAKRAIAQEGIARMQAIEREEANQLADIEAARAAAQSTRDADFNKEAAARAKALAVAKAELGALREKSREQRKEKELKRGPDFKKGTMDLGADTVKQEVFGTFSAAAAMAGGPSAQSIAQKQLEEMRAQGRAQAQRDRELRNIFRNGLTGHA